MKNFVRYILLFCCVFFIWEAEAQTDTSKIVKQFGLKVHQGYVLVHSRDLRPIRNSYPTGVELNFAWHKISQQAWASCHCYPRMGLAATFWDYDNPDVLGYGVTGLFYIEPVFGARHRVSFSIRAGFGLSYQTSPFDAVDNPLNQSYSTYVAFPLQLGGSLHFRLKPKWYLDVTGVYNHFSNGGIREPNKGINWPSGALGFGYYLNRPEFKDRVKRNWREDQAPETRFDLTLFMAFNEPVSKTYLLSPGIELKYSRQIARINALTIGAEWIYDNDARFEIEQNGGRESPHKIGSAIGHEFLMGKFLFSQQFGFYLYKPHPNGQVVYQRYGLVYRSSRRFAFGIALKAHGHVADFLDFRVGISL